jgi:biotin synthase-related radical SAM superfamily protein
MTFHAMDEKAQREDPTQGRIMGIVDLHVSLPERIRASLGSAIVLGLATAKLDSAPTTAYLMTYHQGKCTANCRFCPQARTSTGRADMLSRVSWPVYETQKVLQRVVSAVTIGRIRRICIQALNYPQAFKDLHAIARAINHSVKVPISVSCQPLRPEDMHLLASAGVERIGIPLDAATREVFDATKGANAGGPYCWEKQWQLLVQASQVFGKGNVSTHLIVGLGETEKEMVRAIQECVDIAVFPALFAFTPILGTILGNKMQPPIEQYRRIQIARHLVVRKIVRYEQMDFDDEGHIAGLGISKSILMHITRTGEPFVTSGCPHCNRPFYNEKPSGPAYNFPKGLTPAELLMVKSQISLEKCGHSK